MFLISNFIIFPLTHTHTHIHYAIIITTHLDIMMMKIGVYAAINENIAFTNSHHLMVFVLIETFLLICVCVCVSAHLYSRIYLTQHETHQHWNMYNRTLLLRGNVISMLFPEFSSIYFWEILNQLRFSIMCWYKTYTELLIIQSCIVILGLS